MWQGFKNVICSLDILFLMKLKIDYLKIKNKYSYNVSNTKNFRKQTKKKIFSSLYFVSYINDVRTFGNKCFDTFN